MRCRGVDSRDPRASAGFFSRYLSAFVSARGRSRDAASGPFSRPNDMHTRSTFNRLLMMTIITAGGAYFPYLYRGDTAVFCVDAPARSLAHRNDGHADCFSVSSRPTHRGQP